MDHNIESSPKTASDSLAAVAADCASLAATLEAGSKPLSEVETQRLGLVAAWLRALRSERIPTIPDQLGARIDQELGADTSEPKFRWVPNDPPLRNQR